MFRCKSIYISYIGTKFFIHIVSDINHSRHHYSIKDTRIYKHWLIFQIGWVANRIGGACIILLNYIKHIVLIDLFWFYGAVTACNSGIITFGTVIGSTSEYTGTHEEIRVDDVHLYSHKATTRHARDRGEGS